MKKFINKKAFVLLLSSLLMISAFSGCRKVGDSMSSGNTSDISSEAYGLVDIVDNESVLESVDDTASQPEDINSTPQNTDNTSSDTSSENTVSVEDPVINVNPEGEEIYGSGTADDPYTEIPNVDTQSVTTVSIPAGKSVFYSIRGASNRLFTIEDANAYVIYEDTRYDANGGKVSFNVVSDLLASDYVAFEIGNKGSAAASFVIKFTDIEGSFENPIKVTKISDKATTSFAEGDKIGLYYEYTAEKSGKLHLFLSETIDSTKDFSVAVTNNKDGSGNSATVQLTNDNDLTSTGDDIYEIELDVSKGDIIKIHLAVLKQGRKYPATNIEWYGEYK